MNTNLAYEIERDIIFTKSENLLNVVGMTAQTNDVSNLYSRIEKAQEKGKGMDNFPISVYNNLVLHCLNNGKYRDAMYLVCMANWGMRVGDTIRVRFCHIFDENGNLKKSFTLPDGEQKTGKLNIYYNNQATAAVIKEYLNHNPKTPYDYLFVSESPNKKKMSLRDIEIQELYGADMENIDKTISENKAQITALIKMYSKNMITDDEYKTSYESCNKAISDANNTLSELNIVTSEYQSTTKDADRIMIQLPIGRQVAESIIKDNLADMGLFAKNQRKGKRGVNADVNIDCKLNTHSLRKTFATEFYNKGVDLNNDGLLNVDTTILTLLQNKFMHSSNAITKRYNKTEEFAYRGICTEMNLGMPAIIQYLERRKKNES